MTYNFLGKFSNSLHVLTKFLYFKDISKTFISSGVRFKEGDCEIFPITDTPNLSSYEIIFSSDTKGLKGVSLVNSQNPG